jgi:purine nucleoside phosphorylase
LYLWQCSYDVGAYDTRPVYTRAESAAAFVLSQTALRPQIGLVLGSGLGSFADDLTDAVRIPYADIPTFPRSTAVGHAGQLGHWQVAATFRLR